MGKRFTNPEFFGQLGQPLLVRLVEHFGPEFADQGVQPPDAGLEEKAYFKELATIGISKKGFPSGMSDVLYGIVALGNEEGKDRVASASMRGPKKPAGEPSARHLAGRSARSRYHAGCLRWYRGETAPARSSRVTTWLDAPALPWRGVGVH